MAANCILMPSATRRGYPVGHPATHQTDITYTGARCVLMPAEDVRKLIEGAFADTPVPGQTLKDIIAPPRQGDGEERDIADYFRGTTWRGHSAKDLRAHSSALGYFTGEAFRYWLPAFMIAEIDDPDEADVIAEDIARHMTRRERVDLFDTKELHAIAAFLEECAARYDDGVYGPKYTRAASTVRDRLQ